MLPLLDYAVEASSGKEIFLSEDRPELIAI